jgi:hypothetical protein
MPCFVYMYIMHTSVLISQWFLCRLYKLKTNDEMWAFVYTLLGRKSYVLDFNYKLLNTK